MLRTFLKDQPFFSFHYSAQSKLQQSRLQQPKLKQSKLSVLLVSLKKNLLLKKIISILFISILASPLISCASGPDYKEALDSQYGYKDHKLTEKDYIISFSGRYRLDRATVESFLLRRSAELSLQHNNSGFIVVDLAVDSEQGFISQNNFSLYHGGYGYSGLSGGIATTYPRTRYMGKITIRMAKYDSKNEKSYNAKEILANLTK